VGYTVAAPDEHRESAGGGVLHRPMEVNGEQEERAHQSKEEGEARNATVTLAASCALPFIACTAASPAHAQTLPAKDRGSLHHEGSGFPEDGAVQDGGRKGMERGRQTMRAGEPIKAIVHRLVPDVP
jgi:hypothetical protein